MSSSLPTERTDDKAVDTFGIGTYDSARDSDEHGEDNDQIGPSGTSLPEGGGPTEGFNLEYFLSYPQQTAISAAPPSSGLPSDANNPSARSDYYDTMTTGDSANLWPVEDSGAYVTQEKDWDGRLDSLPTPESNDVSMDDFLGALGNAWSGKVVEDQSNPNGFPSADYVEAADITHLPEGLELQPFGYASSSDAMNQTTIKTATNLEQVSDLTKQFLKAFGRKNLVRRHVLAFLAEEGLPQFLASDIIRCMKHRHDIVIPDVMDTFPVSKTASSDVKKLSAVHDFMVERMIERSGEHDGSSTAFRNVAARLAVVLAALDRLEGIDNG